MRHARVTPQGEAEAFLGLMNRTRDPAAMRWCQVFFHSMQSFSPPKIAAIVFWSVEWGLVVIKDFNHMGRDSLKSERSGGLPAKYTGPGPRAMVEVVLSSPPDCGFTFGPWTIDRLRDPTVMDEVVELSSNQ